MERSEGAGLGIALLGHAALLAALVLVLNKPQPVPPPPTPIEVSISDQVGLVSQAPEINREAPAERKGEEPGPIEPEAAPPPPLPEPEPAAKPLPTPPRPAPAPVPTPVAKPRPEPPKAAPAQARPSAKPSKAQANPDAQTASARPVRPTGRLSGILNGLTDSPSKGTSTRPQATVAGPAVQSALAAEIRRQLKPHWVSPTGADVELLRTMIRVRLNRDGSLAAEPEFVSQTGVNASNRVQAELHKERAIKAVKLAAPFHNLPPEYYDAWKEFTTAFDKRLSS